MRRRRSVSVSVSVEIDPSDVIDELDKDQIAELCTGAGLCVLNREAIEELTTRLHRKDLQGALLALEGLLPTSCRGLADQFEAAIRHHARELAH